MLSKQDLMFSYTIICILATVGFIPVEIDRRSGKEQPITRGFHRTLWLCWFILGGLYAIYNNVRLAQCFLFKDSFVADHLAFHIQIATFSAVGTYWAYRIRICHPHVDIAIFNQLFVTDEVVGRNQALGRRSYTTQEWLLLVLPFCLFLCCTCVFTTFYIYDSSSIQFLYSLLPVQFRHQFVFIFLLVLETSFLEFYMATSYQSIFLQVSFFHNSVESFKYRMSFIQNPSFEVESDRIWKECMMCRQMQLNINLFNDMNAYIIFAVKVYWLTVAIDNYFFGIKFFATKPVPAVALLFLGIFHTCLFSVMYDKAFSVPQRMKEYKYAILVATMKLKDWRKREELKRILESIPLVGIKVGSFHKLERISTPNYIGYIAEKVSALLITSV